MEPDYHNCHFCGTLVDKGYEPDGTRHYLSDCRSDLVWHTPGPTCTWWRCGRGSRCGPCYGYQHIDTGEWTTDHIHFYNDGPM